MSDAMNHTCALILLDIFILRLVRSLLIKRVWITVMLEEQLENFDIGF
jgi:hypothetical protein